MWEQFIFIIAFVILFVGLVFIYKVPDQISLLRSGIICFITELCLGAVLAGIYDLLKLPVGLVSMGSGFFAMALAVWGWIGYHKKIQKVKIFAADIYAFAVLTIFFGVLFLKIFSPDIQLVYTNTDPANHYRMAKKVMETRTIDRMYFASLYNGLIMKLFQPFLAQISLYKAFILADAFFNYLNLLTFYVLLTTAVKSKFMNIVAPFICIFYFWGWPLYSFVVGGFVYFGIGVTLSAYVVYLLICFVNSNSTGNKKALLLLMALGIYSLAVCYMMFVPIVCLIGGIGIGHVVKKEKVAIPRKVLLTAGGVVLGLAIVIFCVCFFGFFKGNLGKAFEALQCEGGIHKQLYEDFLFLLPPVIYVIWLYNKKKKTDLKVISLVIIAGVIGVAFLLCLVGVLSGYYFYKLYFLLWFFCWLVCAQAMEYFQKENKIALYAYMVPVALAVVMSCTGIVEKFANGNLVNANTRGIFPIYELTSRCVFEQNKEDLKDKDALIDMIGYIQEDLGNESSDVLFGVSHEKNYLSAWYRVFSGARSKEIYADSLEENLEQLKSDNVQYFLIQKTADYYSKNKEVFEKFESVYDNGYYGLYIIE